MVLASVDILVDALRDVKLLRNEQFNRLVAELAPKYQDPTELAKHLVKLGWITLYQAKKLVSGHGVELVVGHYVILDKLGEGGMGKVYKAKQLRLNRLVALKVIRPDLVANEMAMKRFQREAKAAAQLTHPNIVRLYDADEAGDRHFLAMEYVEGSDLACVVKENGPLPIGIACSYIRQAAAGLQHAHDLGMVHRDIKPSNLLVTTPGKNGAASSGGVIKILDMGLARTGGTANNDSAATSLTQDGTVIGTPDYMSPEQAKNSSSVDARSDLYSLGCTFYYLLTGHTPFPTGSTLEKLLQHQLDAPKQVQLLRNDLPDEVAAIVHMLLAKRPDERFQCGSALAVALDPWSIFDRVGTRLPDSNAPTTTVPHALPTDDSEAPLPAQTVVEPFNFESVDKPPEEMPATESMRIRPTVKGKPSQWRIAAMIAAPILLIVGILIVRSLMKEKPDNPPRPSEQVNNDRTSPRPIGKKVGPVKREIEPVETYLPIDTELVAVLNVPQLAKSKYFRESLLKHLAEPLDSLRKAGSIDPLSAIERVIVALPIADWERPVIIVQGPEALPQEFTNWVANLDGVMVKEELIPGAGRHRIYVLPDKQKNQPTYGAILQVSPFSFVLSSNKEQVLHAIARTTRRNELRFDEPSVKKMLARYPASTSSAPTLWIGLSAETKLFTLAGKPALDKVANKRDGGIQAVYASLRLGETLDTDVFIESDLRFQADSYTRRINYFFKTLTENNKDPRVERIARLFSSVQPKKGGNGPIYQWSQSIAAEELDEWFAPFFASEAEPMMP